ncbi:MAG: hypothetical protein M3247_00440 [Thermoproteota archaeon]|nr:hypothetical protein [Thermoproteota archaeon]
MKRKKSLSIIAIAVVAVILIGGGAFFYFRYLAPQTVIQTNADTTNCRQGNVLDGVERQARFTVLSTCEMATGTVYDMKGTKEDDGDYQFTLDVEQPYKKLLNDQNNLHASGRLIVEIIPRDQNIPAVQIPKNGDRLEVHGAWVTDNLAGGWNEIHPAWIVKILQ